MDKQQRQVLDSFVRVHTFFEAYPAGGQVSIAPAMAMFDDALRRAREYASAQLSGRDMSRAELRRQWELNKRLVDEHIRPIVTIARAQIDPGSDVGVRTGFRMPMDGLGVTKMLQECDAMIEMARPFEALFIAHGLAEDFLDRFSRTRDALARSREERTVRIGVHVEARAGLRQQLRRCRLAVNRLDAIVRATYARDEVMLRTWRITKRVHQVPGGGAGRADSTAALAVADAGEGLTLLAA